MKKILLASMLLSMSMLTACLGVGNSSYDSVDIKVNAGASSYEVRITNNDNYEWNNVEIGVALTLTGPFYSKKVGSMLPGTTRTVSMSDMDDQGQRFNVFTQKARVIYVKCRTPQGRGWWSGDKD